MWKDQITNITSKTFSESMYYDGNETRSNLPFQMVLYVNLWLFPAWLSIVIVSLDAKYNSLTSIYKLIAIMVLLISLISEVLKLYLGYVGNLSGKIPELASCWFISTLIRFPLEMFLLLDRGILSRFSEIFVNRVMISLLLVEIVTGILALKNLANYRAKTFYLMQIYNGYPRNRPKFDH